MLHWLHPLTPTMFDFKHGDNPRHHRKRHGNLAQGSPLST